jgi:hypothetical protein
MPKAVMVVMTEPVAGKDDEYHEWYENTHLPEILSIPGVSAVQRFVAVPSTMGTVPQQRFVAIYEFDTTVEEAMEQFAKARDGASPPSPALDTSSVVIYTYEAVSDRRDG